MTEPLITSATGVLTALCGVTAGSFLVADRTKWKLFTYFPPLVFVYAVPAVLSNTGVITRQSPTYDWFASTVLPMFLVMMLLKVDVASTIKIIGRGVFVMLFGTAGVILGAPLAYLLVRNHLPPDRWKAFGALAGSWIGGTGNMAAVSEGIGAGPEDVGLAVLADNLVYLIWLPILLASKGFAPAFNRFTRVDAKRIRMLESIPDKRDATETVKTQHFLYLLTLGFACTWTAGAIAARIPEHPPIFTTSTYRILLITTLGLMLSMTPARRIPASHELAMALLYLFIANMGARADVSNLSRSVIWFVLACWLWIAFHGLFCVIGARLLHVDIHTTAIASAANIGAAAGTPIVAAHHNERLVPAGILMALLGYAVGNYGAIVAAWLCAKVAGV